MKMFQRIVHESRMDNFFRATHSLIESVLKTIEQAVADCFEVVLFPKSSYSTSTEIMITVLFALPLFLFFGHQSLKEKISRYAAKVYSATVEVVGPRLANQSTLISRGLTIQVDGEPTELLYHWLLDWLENSLKNLRHVAAIEKADQDEYGKTTKRVVERPGYDKETWFQYKGQWIQLVRKTAPGIYGGSGSYEKIVLSTARWNRALLYELLQECVPETVEDKQKTVMYWVEYGQWNKMGHSKRRRPLTSVILPEEVKERLIKDVKEFLSTEKWYVDRGIPYRRGYLLYGPPGCGKSSFIKGIAGEIGYDICIMSLTAKGMSDDKLNLLMNSTPQKSILLLEDIDAAFKSREDKCATKEEQTLAFGGGGPSSVTFAGLLNALDGVASTEGRIVFMTTNYVDRLDPAMFRPGRVDMKMFVDYPTDKQLAAIFGRFYPDSDEKIQKKFVKKIRELGTTNVSMAAVQGLFMFHKENGEEAIKDVKQYFKDQIMLNGNVNEGPDGLYN